MEDEMREGPPLRLRHDGFTPARQKRFLAVLSETGCVSDACRVAEVSTTSAYRAKRRLGGEFARQWDIALSMARSDLEILAWERGVTGIEEPVYSYGKFTHMRTKRSDMIFRLILQASNPEKYELASARRAAAAAAAEAEEEAHESSDIEMVRERIMRKLDAVKARMLAKGYREEHGVVLPPGWRLEPIKGEEQVEGDWGDDNEPED